MSDYYTFKSMGMWKVSGLLLVLSCVQASDEFNVKVINNNFSNVRVQGLARGDVIKFNGTLDVIKNATVVYSIINLESGRNELYVELNNAEKKINIIADKKTLLNNAIPPTPNKAAYVKVQIINYNLVRVSVNNKVIGDIETNYIGGPKYLVAAGNIRDPIIIVDESSRLPIYKRGIDFRTGESLDFDVNIRKNDLYIYLLADQDLVGYALKTNLKDQSLSFSNNQGDEWAGEETFNATNLRENSILSIRLQNTKEGVKASINGGKPYTYLHQIYNPRDGYRTLFVDSIDASVSLTKRKRRYDSDEDSDED